MNSFKALISNPIDPMFVMEIDPDNMEEGSMIFHEQLQDYLWRIQEISLAPVEHDYLFEFTVVADPKSDCQRCCQRSSLICGNDCQ